MRILLFLIIIVFSLSSQTAYAQSAPQVEGYKPPPMFGMPREEEKAYKPKQALPSLAPLPESDLSSTFKAPLPGRKPVDLTINLLETPTPPKRPNDISMERVKTVRTKPPKSRGVVKGPKTMPAAPSEAVDIETTYADENKKGAVLERHLNQQEDQNQDNKKANPPTSQRKRQLAELQNGNQRLTLPFKSAQTELTTVQNVSLDYNVIGFISENPDWRIQIQSFATPQDTGISSDRRIALSRALAIRDYLLENKIEPEQIDIRALGAETDVTPVDRVDILLLKPGAAG